MDLTSFLLGVAVGGVLIGVQAYRMHLTFVLAVEEAVHENFKKLYAEHKQFMDWRTEHGYDEPSPRG